MTEFEMRIAVLERMRMRGTLAFTAAHASYGVGYDVKLAKAVLQRLERDGKVEMIPRERMPWGHRNTHGWRLTDEGRMLVSMVLDDRKAKELEEARTPVKQAASAVGLDEVYSAVQAATGIRAVGGLAATQPRYVGMDTGTVPPTAVQLQLQNQQWRVVPMPPVSAAWTFEGGRRRRGPV